MSWFWWGRKPEYPEKTLEIRLGSTETQPTYNTCSRCHPSSYQPRSTDFPIYGVSLWCKPYNASDSRGRDLKKGGGVSRYFCCQCVVPWCCTEDFKSRFKTRYMKDSLMYRASILWNTVSFNEHGISQLRQRELRQRFKIYYLKKKVLNSM